MAVKINSYLHYKVSLSLYIKFRLEIVIYYIKLNTESHVCACTHNPYVFIFKLNQFHTPAKQNEFI